MKSLKKLILTISILSVVNIAHAGYDPVTGRFQQQDPLGRGPRIVHTSHGPQWVGTNGPQVSDPRPVAPNPKAGLQNIGSNPNMDHAIALVNSVGRPKIRPSLAIQQQYARLIKLAQTAVIKVHDAQSHLQTGRWTSQEQLNMPEDQYLDGMNLYQYCRSNPISCVDPLWSCMPNDTRAEL